MSPIASAEPPAPLSASSDSLISLPAGAELRREPSHDSPLLAILSQTMLPLLDWRQPWARVQRGELAGWVDLQRPRRAGDAGGPPPLDADLDRLARARRALGNREEVGRLGPWIVYTDLRDTRLVRALDRLAEQVVAVYQSRFGLPAEPGREAIVLFAEERDYRTFEHGDEQLRDLRLDAHATGGVAVLYVGEASSRGLGKTLLHEVAHLLNRRAFGVELPPWLDEGLAGDLALSRIGPRNELLPEPLDRRSIRFGRRIELHASLVWLQPLIDKLGSRSLAPPLAQLQLTRADFQRAEDRPILYALFAFWCRYLATPEAGWAPGFRRFLAGVAAGGPTEPALLAATLDVSWAELERGFETWLRRQPERLELPRAGHSVPRR